VVTFDATSEPVLLWVLIALATAQAVALLICSYKMGVLHERCAWLHDHCVMMSKKLSEKKDEEKK
jgi:hypothetical protein